MKFKLDPFAITLCIDDAMRHNSIDVAINRETYHDIDQILQPPRLSLSLARICTRS